MTARRQAADGTARERRWRWLLPALAIVAFLAVGGGFGPLAGKTSEVQKNDNASYLPTTAEATRVQQMGRAFTGAETMPVFVVYTRAGGLTDADEVSIAGDLEEIADRFADRLAAPPIGPVRAEDGRAAQVILQFVGSDAEWIAGEVRWLRGHVAGTGGLEVHVAGPGGVLADLMEIFYDINGVLLGVTALIILVILVVVYRSPILPVVVLAAAGTALAITNGIVYLLARNDVITVSGQTQGILDVLVLGAGTDYALLLVARFREELRRHADRYDAMRVAWRAAVEPILASGGTVIVGLLCLLASDLASNRGLGPVTAVGITCAITAMLVLLPAVLVLLGRAAFWPFRPGYGSTPAEERGVWGRVAGVVGRRSRLLWVGTVVALLACTFGLFRLEASGIPQTEQFIGDTDSRAGQRVLTAHFPAGTGNPAVIIARADRLAEVLAVAGRVDGVAQVVPYTGATAPAGEDQQVQPKVVGGFVRVDATLTVAPDSTGAFDTVRRLRTAVHRIPGAEAKVGGYSAILYDVQRTAQHDRNVIIPLVLGVVFVILTVLLRALLAPLLLVATVVLSYLATLGVCGVVFRDVFGLPGADSSFPLFAFVFLVALGVDYNIFLMTRVREEVGSRGHRGGTLLALTVTGGVITSAGVVLASTFAALAVLPMVLLAETAFAVAFGVLLDTLVVRSLLVPALTLDIGPAVWWPGRLRAVGAERDGTTASGIATADRSAATAERGTTEDEPVGQRS